MKITIEFRTNNAAFEDNPGEVEHVLAGARRTISAYAPELGHSRMGPADNYMRSFEHSLHDSNGNTVGTVRGELDE